MKSEAQRIAIAEWCGWRWNKKSIHTPSGRRWARYAHWSHTDQLLLVLPDYLNDLNAMHEAESKLNDEQWPVFRDKVSNLVFKATPATARFFRPISATAAQRAESLLRTIGKWDDKEVLE